MAREDPCPCRIPLGDVAIQTGATVEFVQERADHAGYIVRDDWAGRPSLAVRDAAALVLWLRARPE